jgi:hypothetical protein
VDRIASLILLGFVRSSFGNCWTFHDPALGGPGKEKGHLSVPFLAW